MSRKRRERRPADRICCLYRWHTTDMDVNAAVLHWQVPPPSLRKDAGATTAHQGSTAAATSLMGTNLFPLEGEISNIGQPVNVVALVLLFKLSPLNFQHFIVAI
jgi:hypothetical protein